MFVGHLSQVKLKDSVVSALRFCKAKEIELAWIDAVLDLSHAKTDTGCVTDGQTSDSKGTEQCARIFHSQSCVCFQL